MKHNFKLELLSKHDREQEREKRSESTLGDVCVK
jgi:hypothetical protein